MKNKKYMKYTSKHDAVILDCIKKNPHNITVGLEQAAKRLDVTFASVFNRYYKRIRPNKKVSAFALVSKRYGLINIKNITRNQNVEKSTKMSNFKILNTIKKWLK